MSNEPMVLYGTPLSGHTHRVALLLRALKLAYREELADAARRATPEFRALNPLGQVPVLRDGAVTLVDSNAILVYLAKRYAPGSAWWPDDAQGAAAVQRWFSIAAGEVRYGPCAARMTSQWNYPGDPQAQAALSARLLAFMETHLQGVQWLVDPHITLADLACYSYVAHAPEGGIPLEPYPAVRAWLARVEAQPWFTPMPTSPRPAPTVVEAVA